MRNFYVLNAAGKIIGRVDATDDATALVLARAANPYAASIRPL